MKHIKSFDEFVNESASAAEKMKFLKKIKSSLDNYNSELGPNDGDDNTYIIFYEPNETVIEIKERDEFGDWTGEMVKASPFATYRTWDTVDKDFSQDVLAYSRTSAITDSLSIYKLAHTTIIPILNQLKPTFIYMEKENKGIYDSITKYFKSKIPLISLDEAKKLVKETHAKLEKSPWLNFTGDDAKFAAEYDATLTAMKRLSKEVYGNGSGEITVRVTSKFKSIYVGKTEDITDIKIDLQNKSIFYSGGGTKEYSDIKDLVRRIKEEILKIKTSHQYSFNNAENSRANDNLTHDRYR